LESRLVSDPQLSAVMDDLRAARGLLRKLPQRRAPRNFTLNPKMAGLKAPEPRTYPTFRLAGVLATLLLFASFAVNGLAPLATSHLAAAPVPAYGMGGGGSGPEGTAPQESVPATEAPLQTFAAIEGTPTPEAMSSSLPQATQSADLVQPTPEPYSKGFAPPSADNSQPSQVQSKELIPFGWQIALAILALISGAAAWLIRRNNEQKFRKQWDRK
jgi:hypothetical protein